MVPNSTLIVKHLQSSNHWQLCIIENGEKLFFGWSEVSGGKWVKYLANKVENCTDAKTISQTISRYREAKPNVKVVPVYYITEDDPVIGVDIDYINRSILESSSTPHRFNIPFPVIDYFVENSPSGSGCHIWCLVEPEVKTSLLNQYNRKIVFDNDVTFAHHIEYRMTNCLLTVTGNKFTYSDYLTIGVSPTVQHLKSRYREQDSNDSSNEAIKTIITDCIAASLVFKAAVENTFSDEELARYKEEGISELLFSLARVIHQRTGSNDPELYYRILSRLEIVRSNSKWLGKEHKLKRWCEDNTTFEAITRVEEEKAVLISNISDKELAEIAEEPQSLVIDPKAPDGLLVPLFMQGNPHIYPVSNGFYRYVPNNTINHYVLYSKQEIVAFAEDFYRRLIPSKSATAIHNLASASVRYLVVQSIQVGAIRNIIFPENIFINGKYNTPHTYIHLADSIYDIEADEFIDETPDFLSTSKLSVSKDHFQNCMQFDDSKWNSFLLSSFNRDLETIESLKRFFGYVISTDCDKQKALVLRGEAGSGKGTLVSVISSVLNASVASTSMQQLDEKFGFSVCLNKSLLVMPEMPRNMRTYHGAWERLKAIISADPVSVELKGQQAFSTVLKTKVIICTNYDLSYDGDMNSLNRRLIYCTLPQSFGGTKSLEVDYKSLLSSPEEQAVILNWIIEGYKLYKQSGLTQSGVGYAALEDAAEDTDLILDFIKQELERGEDNNVVRNGELKAAFKRFCDNSDVSPHFRPSARTLPAKIKSHIAKNWFNVPTTELDYRSSLDRGILRIKFKNKHNYDDIDLADCAF